MVKVKKDLTGKRFGRLVVIKQIEDFITTSGKHYSYWRCKCDCGNEIDVIGAALTKNQKPTRSCGCIQKEIVKNKFKKYNDYKLLNEYGIGYLDDGTEFYFDLEDYDKIKDIKWKKDKDGYIVSNVYNKDTKKTIGIKMHRLIMDCPDDKYIDHKENERKNDNRKSNLRECTLRENNMHRKKAKNNTSGITGVYWHSCINKWTAFIYYNGKRIELGNFDNFEHAKAKRLEAERKYHGKFSYNANKNIA